jgi:hypothetical protein
LLLALRTLLLLALLPGLLLTRLPVLRRLLPLLTLWRLLTLFALLALWGLAVRLIQAPVEGVLLHPDDLFELSLQVIEHRGEVELIELLAALLTQLLEEVAEALHAVALWVSHPALEQVTERVLEVTEVHQVIGEVIEDVVRFERRDFLGAVPHRIAIAQSHGASVPLQGCGQCAERSPIPKACRAKEVYCGCW